jgi:hypothetical protein
MVIRKIPFILFGLLTVAILLFALKFFAFLFDSMPKVEQQRYKKTDVAQLIDNLMWEDNGSLAKIYWIDSMDRLVKMGEAVVPDLINAIETAHDKATTGTYQSEQPSEWAINHDTEMLQIRAAMVLGRIGDVRAIPVLTNFQCRDGRLICYYVAEALKSIQEKGR